MKNTIAVRVTGLRRRVPSCTAVGAGGVALGAMLAVALCSASPLGAQGSLSSLGFGYPVGGMSTRAAGTGGAFGEFDPLSAINPASLGGLSRLVVSAQTEPEYRTVHVGSVREKTTAQRLPLISLIFPAGRGVAVGVSASTYLDRSYSTVTSGEVVFDGQKISTTDRTDVRGSIADLRAAAGWQLNSRFSVGASGHLITGDNLVSLERSFSDSLRFGDVLDSSRVEYFGTALSVGGEWRVLKGLAAIASYRMGNGIDSRIRDTVRTSATVPNRIGAAIRYDGIPGSVFAVGIDQQQWSSLRGLGSTLVQPNDATNWHAGAELTGPRFLGSQLLMRAGYAKNELPFGIGSSVVEERRISVGMGLPIANERAGFDFSLQRANRTLSGNVSRESAWLLGFGVQIRP